MEFLKTTFLGFCHEEKESTSASQPRTQTLMADPLITESGVRRALECFILTRVLAVKGFSPRYLTLYAPAFVVVLA